MIFTQLEKKLKEAFTDNLHGSGWDGEWNVEILKNWKIKATISYHHMNDVGYYDGWSTVIAYIDSDLNLIRVQFSTNSTKRERYCWDREYYESTICQMLTEVRDSKVFS